MLDNIGICWSWERMAVTSHFQNLVDDVLLSLLVAFLGRYELVVELDKLVGLELDAVLACLDHFELFVLAYRTVFLLFHFESIECLCLTSLST